MNFDRLRNELEGELFTHEAIKRIYATDASAYREVPRAVAIPRNERDIKKLIDFAASNATSLIPRTAGTSLAGQVVGDGIIVDVSKYFNHVIELNLEEGYVWVQPGIVRDELNRSLAKHGVFFAPETSTANRAMIGGMIGNNSCGSNSVVFGSTREHLIAVKVLLSDGSEAHFSDKDELSDENGFANRLYQNVNEILSDKENRNRIKTSYPKSSIPRRNTGYALDLLAEMTPFETNGKPFNFSSLIAGSEGTLAFVTAAKLKLTKIPPSHKRLVCIHSKSIDESLRANLVALTYRPHACELMDHYILEATKRNKEQNENRFFVEGDPQAILVVELIRDSESEVDEAVTQLIADLSAQQLGYAFPVIKGGDIKKVWNLRKAGLGLLSNIPGDDKPAPVIEDTAVDVKELPAYIEEFNAILKKHDLYSVHYAHAGSGELHLRPIINLKTERGRQLFRTIAEEIATLVKKYNGSLSGEHGDGRLRGEFIPQMIGEENYQLLKKIKRAWDPDNIFNPGKIVDTAPMDTMLRYEIDKETKTFDTVMDFSEDQGIVRAAELCNGSGDCRKSELTGGGMCPSYMATREEKDTTRARANILREFLTRSDHDNPFEHQEIKEVMDLCLSCKACKRECPSNVDMAKLKAEWQHQSYQTKGIPWRTKMIANYSKSMERLKLLPQLYNLTRNLSKPVLGFEKERSIPKMANRSLRSWYRKKFHPRHHQPSKKKVYFFFDEFTNYLDVEIGKKAIQLLDRLGYEVLEVKHAPSGRAYLSKGILDEAQKLAKENVTIFSELIDASTPLVGIEPSAILAFRDEYTDLLRGKDQKKAKELAQHVFMIDEFLVSELEEGNISSNDFPKDKKKILVHGHCHQKALGSMVPIKKLLSTPENYEAQMIPSGCCGMAGSFGYEKAHYDVSMKIGELVLFPKVRAADQETCVVASGTSCRHQILDGTGRRSYHLVELL
ncbi:MAG: FAD-linked oxidase C-terminal domain-containing protein [Bacteroidota bacterium]